MLITVHRPAGKPPADPSSLSVYLAPAGRPCHSNLSQSSQHGKPGRHRWRKSCRNASRMAVKRKQTWCKAMGGILAAVNWSPFSCQRAWGWIYCLGFLPGNAAHWHLGEVCCKTQIHAPGPIILLRRRAISYERFYPKWNPQAIYVTTSWIAVGFYHF